MTRSAACAVFIHVAGQRVRRTPRPRLLRRARQESLWLRLEYDGGITGSAVSGNRVVGGSWRRPSMGRRRTIHDRAPGSDASPWPTSSCVRRARRADTSFSEGRRAFPLALVRVDTDPTSDRSSIFRSAQRCTRTPSQDPESYRSPCSIVTASSTRGFHPRSPSAFDPSADALQEIVARIQVSPLEH